LPLDPEREMRDGVTDLTVDFLGDRAGQRHVHFLALATVDQIGSLWAAPKQAPHVLPTRDRRVMRLATSRLGRRLGKVLMHRAGRAASALSWELHGEPLFHNNIGTLRFDGEDSQLLIEVTVSSDGHEQRLETAITQ
jgi:hypothetical protein